MSRQLNLTIALAILAAAANGYAFTWQMCGGTKVKWPTGSVTMRASAVGFPAGSTWRSALDATRTRFNQSPANMRYLMLFDDPSIGMGNGQSEVWWSSGFGAPAITYTWWNGSCQLVEADIIFDNTVAYTTSTTKTSLIPYGGPYRPFQTTAMHELGHGQGLGHTADRYSIMGQDWTHIHSNGSTANAYPGGDAIAGSVSTYGIIGGAYEDLGIAHWRRTGASGEYSIHQRTRVLNTSGVELAKIISGGQPVYLVNKGQTVKLEMTYENMGKTSPITSGVNYYVSTNDTISAADTFLGAGSVTLYRGTATTSNTTLVIPNNLVSGTTYYLGGTIDPTGAYVEYSESNNATYVGIKIN
ncbi:MAG: hypothetical protein U0166_28560 [Acidobacteriota bacterium]